MKDRQSYTIRRVTSSSIPDYKGLWCVTVANGDYCTFLYCKTRAGAREAVKRMKGVQ